MEQWEYLVVWTDVNGEVWMDSNGTQGEIKRFPRTKIGSPPRYGEMLNARGIEGWELVHVQDDVISTFWFKRRAAS